jgi:hypothetical protein
MIDYDGEAWYRLLIPKRYQCEVTKSVTQVTVCAGALPRQAVARPGAAVAKNWSAGVQGSIAAKDD